MKAIVSVSSAVVGGPKTTASRTRNAVVTSLCRTFVPSSAATRPCVSAMFPPTSPPPCRVDQNDNPPATHAGWFPGFTNLSPWINPNNAPQT